MTANLIYIVSILASALLFSACSFGHKNFSQTGALFKEPDEFVVQLDDYGAFWDPGVAERALKTITEQSRTSNTIVVLYIHGWHHNAQVGDKNVSDFHQSLTDVRKTLNDVVYRQSRTKLTVDDNIKVIGIYVGWRGKSLPMPLDYFTLFGRKAAAERVGGGDLREFLLRLNEVYDSRNGIRGNSHAAPFMGMISFGHSFGGQVLFKAISETLENRLIDAAAAMAKRGDNRLPKPLTGFGDIIVLVNPALEAAQYERINKLNMQIHYDRRQTPLLMVLSSENDTARKSFFPVGQWIGSLFHAPFRQGQGEMWRKALGEYEPQRTHTLSIEPMGATGVPLFDPSIYSHDPCVIVNLDLADDLSIGGATLAPMSSHRQPFSPYLVTPDYVLPSELPMTWLVQP